MKLHKGSRTFEITLLLETALGLDFAEYLDGALELAGESQAVHAKGGELRD
jgi:hypothetical protein